MHDILMISISVSVVIALLLLLSPLMNRRYSAQWRCWIWLVLAIRLCIPCRVILPITPEKIPTISNVIALPTQQISDTAVSQTEHIQKRDVQQERAAGTDKMQAVETQNILFAVWAVGAVLFFAIHIGSYIVFWRRVQPFCRQIEENMYRCNRIAGPMMIGFFRPVILLPEIDYSAQEEDIIVTHEMAHFKRHDLWYKLVLLLANAMHWFNPFVYKMVRCASRDLECACDDDVIRGKDITFRKYYSMVIWKTMGGN